MPRPGNAAVRLLQVSMHITFLLMLLLDMDATAWGTVMLHTGILATRTQRQYMYGCNMLIWRMATSCCCMLFILIAYICL